MTTRPIFTFPELGLGWAGITRVDVRRVAAFPFAFADYEGVNKLYC